MSILDRCEPRDDYAVRVLAVHTTEGVDHPRVDDAAALRDATWWTGSSHAIADNDPGVLLTPAEGCVPYDLAAWTLRSGNRWSENIELVGFASWTRAEWLARPVLLDRCAFWLADRSKARRIPLVKLTPAQYHAGHWGVIGHVDHTVGYSDGTHWDPGPDFPWDVVITKARAYAAGLNPGGSFMADLTEAEQRRLLTRVDYLYDNITPGTPGVKNDSGHWRRWNQQIALLPSIAATLATLDGADPGALAAAVAAELKPLLRAAVLEGMAADTEDQADEIVDRIAARLTGTPADRPVS